jgi:hypothetical protein
LGKNVLSKDCVVEYHGSTLRTHWARFRGSVQELRNNG